MLLIPVTITGPVIISQKGGGRTLGEAGAQDVRCTYMDIGHRQNIYIEALILSSLGF